VETTLSDSGQAKVEWKLNDLLVANRQAREFASRQLADPDDNGAGFSPWMPRQLAGSRKSLAEQGGEDAPDIASPAEAAVPEAEPAADSAQVKALQDEIERLKQDLKAASRKRYEEGYEQGKQEVQQAMEDQRVVLEGLITGLQDARIDIRDYVAYVEGLSLALARAVVRQAAAQHPDYYQNLVRQGIELLNLSGEQEIRLYVHPDAVALVQAHLDTMESGLRLLPDTRLRMGDLRLACGHTEIEENVEEKLDAAFLELVRKLDGEG
jgi:flagellar assembly protein FliH